MAAEPDDFRAHGSTRLAAGKGLVSFPNVGEAAAGARAIVDDDRHARAIAEEHLDSDTVLGALLEDAL